jgi:hypothetical protein
MLHDPGAVLDLPLPRSLCVFMEVTDLASLCEATGFNREDLLFSSDEDLAELFVQLDVTGTAKIQVKKDLRQLAPTPPSPPSTPPSPPPPITIGERIIDAAAAPSSTVATSLSIES